LYISSLNKKIEYYLLGGHENMDCKIKNIEKKINNTQEIAKFIFKEFNKEILTILRAFRIDTANHLDEVKECYTSIIQSIFGENSTIYVDEGLCGNYVVELHFQDCNYYQLEHSGDDSENTVVLKIIDCLLRERITDKISLGVNSNNERYFKKHSK
jgi:hypothetical protein